MRGTLTLKILQAVKEMSVEGLDLCEAIIVAGYGASGFKIRRIQERLQEERLRNSVEVERGKRYVRNYQKLISKLKLQGLLNASEREGRSFFSITPKGKSKLLALESQLKRRFAINSYRVSPSARSVIVSFDIPEIHKRKRDWVREVLKRLGLTMVHKSVWTGKVKIPEEFLDDLHTMNILDYIEIFEVGKSGTLHHIT